jgi:hypothetical protein
MHLAINIGGIPHLAKKSEGHPSFVREPGRLVLLFFGSITAQTLPGSFSIGVSWDWIIFLTRDMTSERELFHGLAGGGR